MYLDLLNINIVPGQMVPIARVAFAGDRGISKFELSTDGGVTWKSASIKDPLSNYTWVLWTTGFIPSTTISNNYSIIVRAIDKTGKVQTANSADFMCTKESNEVQLNLHIEEDINRAALLKCTIRE